MFAVFADSPGSSVLSGVSRTLGFAEPTPPAAAASARRKLRLEQPRESPEEGGAHDWENIKENAKPIKRGRRISKLNQFARESRGTAAAAAGGLSVRMSVVKRKNDRQSRLDGFEQAVAAAAADPDADALKPWLAYIRWCEDEYPEGGIQSRQLVLLERCCRSLMKDERYRNDGRYLKCWLKYADLLEDPNDLFRFLCVNRIGERCSLFYVAWALVSEQRKNYGLTDKIFTRGKRIGAKPSKMLDQRHRQFQRRMARKWLRQEQGEDDAAHTGRLSEAGNELSSSHQVRQSGRNDENAGGIRRRRRGGLAGGVSNTRLGRNGGRSGASHAGVGGNTGVSTLGNFSIFVEGEDGAVGAGGADAGAGTAAATTGGVLGNGAMPRRYDDLVDGSPGSLPATWDFQGKKEVIKENDGPITRWNEAGLKLVGKRGRAAERRSRRQRGGSNFAICVDEEEDERIKTTSSSASSSGSHTATKSTRDDARAPPDTVSMRRRMEGHGRTAAEQEALELFKDPLKNFRIAGEDLGDALDTERLTEPKTMPPPPPRPATAFRSSEPTFAPPPVPAGKISSTFSSSSSSAIRRNDTVLAARPPRSKNAVKGGYDMSLLGEKEAYSFEEHRAAMMKRRLQARLRLKREQEEAAARKLKEEQQQQQQEQQQAEEEEERRKMAKLAKQEAERKLRDQTKPRARFGAGSAGRLQKSRRAAAAAASRRKGRRATLGAFRDADELLDSSSDEEAEDFMLKQSVVSKQQKRRNIGAPVNSAHSSSEDDEDEHSVVGSIKAAPKALSFSNCSSAHTASGVKHASQKSSVQSSVQRGLNFSGPQCAATPMPGPGNSYAATRKLMFGSDLKRVSSVKAPSMPKPNCDIFSDSSDDDEDGAQEAGAATNAVDTSMTCNLRAAMEDLGDLFCSPGLDTRAASACLKEKDDEKDDEGIAFESAAAAVVDENAAPNVVVQSFPKKIIARSIHDVEPDAVLRSMAEHEYPSAPPTQPEIDSDSEEEDQGTEQGNGLFGGANFHIFNEDEGTQDFTGVPQVRASTDTADAARALEIFNDDDDESADTERRDSNEGSTTNILAAAKRALQGRSSDIANTMDMIGINKSDTGELLANTMDLLNLVDSSDEEVSSSLREETGAASRSPAFSILNDVFGDGDEAEIAGGVRLKEIQETGEDDTANINMSNLHDLSSICCEDEENVSMSRRWSDVSSAARPSALPPSEPKNGGELPFSIFMD